MAHPLNTQLMGPKVSPVPSPPPGLLTLVPFSWLTSCYNFCQQATVLLPKSAPCPQRLGWGGECFSFILQIVPMEPTEYSKQPENPIIHGESLQQPSSEDNRALITARLTLLNCAHEQKKSMRQTQTLARGHGKTWEHSMAWPPECRLSFTPSLWWDFFFTTSFFFFWLFHCWESGDLQLPDPKMCMVLLSSQWKQHNFPFYTWPWESQLLPQPAESCLWAGLCVGLDGSGWT